MVQRTKIALSYGHAVYETIATPVTLYPCTHYHVH